MYDLIQANDIIQKQDDLIKMQFATIVNYKTLEKLYEEMIKEYQAKLEYAASLIQFIGM